MMFLVKPSEKLTRVERIWLDGIMNQGATAVAYREQISSCTNMINEKMDMTATATTCKGFKTSLKEEEDIAGFINETKRYRKG
jgi:hypothetical protein